MDLTYLDRLIPKRWVLLLRYYLPFFKKPAPLYFKLRELINQKKYESPARFNLKTLYDLFVILDTDSQADPDDLSNKIIDSIIFNQKDLIKGLSLEAFIEQFDSKISDYLIDKFLNRLPQSIFQEYITILNKSLIKSKKEKSYYKKHIKYCKKLSHHFNSNAKLIFFLLVPDDLISDKLNHLEQSIGLESLLAMNFLKVLYADLKDNFLNFIMKWKKYLNGRQDDCPRSLNSIFSKNEEETVLLLNENLFHFFNREKISLFKNSLIQTNHHNESLIEAIFNFLTEQQALEFINKLIIDHFDPLGKKTSDISTFLLIEKNLEKYPLNLFQTLAIFYATKKTINSNTLAEKYDNFCFSNTDLEIFSLDIQVSIIENSIKSIQAYISEMIIEKTEQIPEKLSLHTLWRQFLTNTWIDAEQPLPRQIDRILEKIPPAFKTKEKASLDLFKQLYSYLETPALKKFKLEEEEKQRKQQADAIIKEEEIENLRKLISHGTLFQISYQRMDELFDKQAGIMVEKWRKKGIGFFDANDKKVADAVISNTKDMKDFDCNAFQLT